MGVFPAENPPMRSSRACCGSICWAEGVHRARSEFGLRHPGGRTWASPERGRIGHPAL